MYKTETPIRVRYSETDRMNFVYYGHYAQYFEVARVEALRSLGISYREMEEGGILLPVYDYRIKFLKPAFYDEILTIKTTIPSLPAAKIIFNYETLNSNGEIINEAQTTLVFVHSNTMKPCKAPQSIINSLLSYF